TLFTWQVTIKQQTILKVEDVPPTISENDFYAQSHLLNKALEQVQFGEFAQPHWYFLGVAGASYQDVFKFEIARIPDQFDTRFGTFGRSVE
ncbi:peptidase C13 family protein, partial [Acinetobacter guillouiae]